MANKQTLSIVIPAYQESKRLPPTLQSLADLRLKIAEQGLDLQELIIVDDGSSDKTAQVAQSFAANLPVRVISYKPNQGKGHAVRTGCLVSQSDLTLIADADMSTPWLEVFRLRDELDRGCDIAIGSRSVADSRIDIRQPWYRERMGKTFNLLMRLITGLPFRDTQCGFKLFKTKLCADLWPRLRVNRFAWDIEFLMAARQKGLRIREIGVEWNHRDESRVHPVVDSLEMLFSVLRVRLRIKSMNSTD